MVPGNYKAKYAALVHRYNKLVRVVQKNNLVFKRLARNYALLRQRLLSRDRTVTNRRGTPQKSMRTVRPDPGPYRESPSPRNLSWKPSR
jgi:hypothetical protein